MRECSPPLVKTFADSTRILPVILPVKTDEGGSPSSKNILPKNFVGIKSFFSIRVCVCLGAYDSQLQTSLNGTLSVGP
jgi:hypothetical protein